ncbi:MAG: UbiX family flavin prenyltransferase [Bradyrhizobiaceae bacterium]|nr:MAG: UbiX family flavin prenyltransferase [Bradyrhizobiaceae bacterium]
MSGRLRIVVGISGASGAALGVRVVELLAETGQCDIHLVVTHHAERTLLHEVGRNALSALASMATRHHADEDIGASIASGSFRTAGMIVAPCSIRTLSAIATSAANNLLVRAADVQLKERRRLVLMVRETPLHLGHLRAMTAATEIGAIIAPPVPAFYHKPASMAEVIDQIARRAIDLLDLDLHLPVHEWEGEDRVRDAGQR